MFNTQDVRQLIITNVLVIFGFVGFICIFDRIPTDTTSPQGQQVYETINTHKRTPR